MCLVIYLHFFLSQPSQIDVALNTLADERLSFREIKSLSADYRQQVVEQKFKSHYIGCLWS